MKSFVATLIFITFVTLSGFGLLAITGINGHHHQPGCPFMVGEHAICTMTALDHIIAWQNAFTTTIPTLSIYFFFATAVLFVYKYYSPPNLFIRRFLSSRTNSLIFVSLWQELFSSGILNPKAP